MIFLCARSGGKSIQLPIINIKAFLIIDKQISQILDVFRWTCTDDISQRCGRMHIARAGALDILRERPLQLIAALRSKPHSKTGAKITCHIWRGIQLIGELVIEFPKSGLIISVSWSWGINACIVRIIVIVPSIIDHVSVQRPITLIAQAVLHSIERFWYAFVCDVHHIVVPGIVLHPEIRLCGDRIDICIKISLHDIGVRSLCRADHVRPCLPCTCFIQAAFFAQLCQALAGVIADLHCIVFHIGVCGREFWSEEHAVRIDRLSQ